MIFFMYTLFWDKDICLLFRGVRCIEVSTNGGFIVANIFSCEVHFLESFLVVLPKSLIDGSDKKIHCC